jgi:hypothetical protein
MKIWTEELAQVEAAALRVEALEHEAERRFDSVRAEALARGDAEQVHKAPELSEWMAARAATDAAWGRWAQVMDASLDGKDSGA